MSVVCDCELTWTRDLPQYRPDIEISSFPFAILCMLSRSLTAVALLKSTQAMVFCDEIGEIKSTRTPFAFHSSNE